MISRECRQAISEKNILRLRLMLKNSLLLDTSFRSFWEIETEASKNAIDVWEHNSEFGFQRKPQPWTIDDVNYEITAIVGDFTRDHMKYLMEMIKTVYGNDNNPKKPKKKDPVPAAKYQEQIISLLSKMISKIEDNREDDTRKLLPRHVDNVNWNSVNWNRIISEVREQAERIAICCEELEDQLKRR